MVRAAIPRTETIHQSGYGFHHVGIDFEDVEAVRQAYYLLGCQERSHRHVPSGGKVYY